ncbi:MAG: hypothetical protein ABIJ33_01405 [Patescibacteria group bacterium]
MKRLLMGLILGLLVLLVSWTLLRPGMFRAHDYVHGARIAEMSRILEAGQVPPRWSQNFGFGYGMPLFSFYAPLPYFLGALLTELNFSVTTSIKLLYILCHLVTTIGMYRLGSKWYGRLGGILAAGLILLAPYRAVNIYVRGALSELWGMMTIPWILLSIELILENCLRSLKTKGQSNCWQTGWLMLAGWTSILLLSHNITAIILLPLGMIWLVILTIKYQSEFSKYQRFWQNWWRAIGQMLLGAGLGLGLASFYVWPAILEKNLTRVDDLILGGYFDYHLHFLYLRQFIQTNWGYGGSSWGPEDGLSFFLGYGQVLGLGLLSLFLMIKVWQWLRTSRRQPVIEIKLLLSIVMGLGIGLLMLMTTLKTQWLWNALPILVYIQFPWRFNGVILPLVALAVASLLGLVPKHFRFITFGFLLIVTCFNLKFFKPSDDRDYTQVFYYTDETLIREQMSGILPDYIPKTLDYENLEPATNLIYSGADQFKSVDFLVDRVDAHLLEVEASEPTQLIFSIAEYPGWQVEIDGQVQSHQMSDLGLIQVMVPAGRHQVGILWTETGLRQIANAASVLALIFWIGLLPVWRKSESTKML